MLDEVRAGASGPDLAQFARALVETKDDGRIKMFVTWRALDFRRAHADTFLAGDYQPRETQGVHADHIVAFSRGAGDVIVVVPRLLARLRVTGAPVGPDVWGDTRVAIGADLEHARFRHLFTGETITVENAALSVGEALRDFPLALLSREPT